MFTKMYIQALGLFLNEWARICTHYIHIGHCLLLKAELGYIVLTFYSKFAEIEASQVKIHFGGQFTSVPLSREAFEVQHQYLRKPLNTKGLSTFTMCFALSTSLSI